MGGGWNYKRLRLLAHKYENLAQMNRDKEHESAERTEITTLEQTCPQCGFKARYKFIRCPICGDSSKSTKKINLL